MNATQLNKEAVIKYCAHYKVSKITLEYNGSGDNGQIEDVTCFDAAGNEMLIPDDNNEIENFYDLWSSTEGKAVKSRTGSFLDLVEQLAYSTLCQTYGGWEINEGSYGTITIHDDGSGLIEHNEIIQDTEYSEHSF
jgi:hypothetical protein